MPSEAAVVKLERARLTADDWEKAALESIASDGVASLAVESLARRMGVTKGSFYWHFANRDALLAAALARWERSDTHNLIARIETLTDPRERLRELFRATSRDMRSHRTYAALLKAADNHIVAPVLERVAAERMQYLARVFAQAGMQGAESEHRARLAYSAYVGFLQLTLQLNTLQLGEDDLSRYIDHVTAVLIP
ncbi:MAG: TetR/AcrR family transcriptional regulator [Xanthomonadales bacterium]|nr:TetR/AcrR family transcriptional regulator [Xanthomonadales bacterium]